jgi:hypothetical protein
VIYRCSATQYLNYRAAIGWTDEQGSGHGLIKVLPRYLPGGTEKNHRNLNQNSGVPVKIQTKHINMAEGCVLDSFNSRQAPIAGSFEQSNEPSCSIRGRENLDFTSLLASHEGYFSSKLIMYVIPCQTVM